jgi:hypothetical protein
MNRGKCCPVIITFAFLQFERKSEREEEGEGRRERERNKLLLSFFVDAL